MRGACQCAVVSVCGLWRAACDDKPTAQQLAKAGGWELRHCVRMLRATRQDAELARAKLLAAERWRRAALEPWRRDLEAQLGACETRVIAVGQDERPLVYTGCVHQRRGEDGARLLALVWDAALREADERRQDCAQLDYVLDARGFQYLLNLNPLPYLEVAKGMDGYFAERFHRIIVLDMGTAMTWLWQLIKPLLPPKTAQKIFFLSRDDLDPLFELCDQETRACVEDLLRLNASATPRTGRQESHALTNALLERQRLQNGHLHKLSTAACSVG